MSRLGAAQLLLAMASRGFALLRHRCEMLTVREVAAVLRVSTATVYKLVATGELSHVRVGNSDSNPARLTGPNQSRSK